MSALLREQLHLSGRDYLFKGDYTNALLIFNEAITKYKSHIGILADISTVYYLMGNNYEWNISVQKFKNELELIKENISPLSLIRSYILLGKMHEEQGFVSEALIVYDKALFYFIENFENDHISNQTDVLKYKIQIESQMLRILTFLNLKVDALKYYKNLIIYKEKNPQFIIEIDHALMLAELSLIGVNSAKMRLIDLLNNKNLIFSDYRLMIFDFLEIALFLNFDVQFLLPFLNKIKIEDLDSFEKIILEIFTHKCDINRSEIDFIRLNKLSNKLTFLSYLRILTLRIYLTKKNEIENELILQLNLLLDTLDSKSKQLLIKKWNNLFSLNHIELNFNFSTNTISSKNYFIQIKNNSFQFKCIKSFLFTKSMDISEFVRLALEETFNENHYDRIRMAVSRFNKELSVITGLPKTFILTKNKIELTSQVRIINLE